MKRRVLWQDILLMVALEVILVAVVVGIFTVVGFLAGAAR